jgi:hypothetical protein
MACYNWHGQVHITMHYVVHHMQCIVMFGSTKKYTQSTIVAKNFTYDHAHLAKKEV